MTEPAPQSLSVIFRKAAVRDVPRLVDLYNECFSKWSRDLDVVKYMNNMTTNKDWNVIVAEDKPGHVAAFVLVNCHFAESHGLVNVDVLAVDGNCRRMKLGEKLMHMSEAVARNAGVNFLTLQVHEDNEPGKQLYLKLGFNFVGERRPYYSDGRAALEMLKFLPPGADAANDHAATQRPASQPKARRIRYNG